MNMSMEIPYSFVKEKKDRSPKKLSVMRQKYVATPLNETQSSFLANYESPSVKRARNKSTLDHSSFSIDPTLMEKVFPHHQTIKASPNMS